MSHSAFFQRMLCHLTSTQEKMWGIFLRVKGKNNISVSFFFVSIMVTKIIKNSLQVGDHKTN